MPGTDGLTATRRLAANGRPGPRVLVLTTFDLDAYVYEALRAGASGFLLKTRRARSSCTPFGAWRPATSSSTRF